MIQTSCRCSSTIPLLVLPAVAVLCSPGPAQELLFRWTGPDRFANFGFRVVDAGDLDSDGLSDIAVSAAGENGFSVFTYSGSDGGLLWQRKGDHSDKLFGYALASTGDLSSDGIPDLLVGELGTSQIYLLSGKDGSDLFRIVGDSSTRSLGASLDGNLNLDQDSIPDFVCGATAADVAGIDLNGDGIPEFLAGALQINAQCPTAPGYARLCSGKDGTVLWSGSGEQDRDQFGREVTGTLDVSGDGVGDFLVGAPQPVCDPLPGGPGYVCLYSGRTFRRLYKFVGEADKSGFFISGRLADLNGDGLAEVLIGSPTLRGPRGSAQGAAYVYAGNDLYLNSSPKSVAANELLTLTVGESAPGSCCATFLVEVNGNPVTSLIELGVFAGDEGFERSYLVPAGLAGLRIGVIAFALHSGGKVIDSAVETVQFQ